MNKILVLVCCSLCFCLLYVKGQSYDTQITKIVDEQGIAPGSTFAIIEDSVGFIWFGTTDGLYRYDGYNLKVYRNIPGQSNTLSNNTIRGLALDHEGKLWIATQGGGLNCLDINSETFTYYLHNDEILNSLSGNSLWALWVDQADRIWVGVTGKGVDVLDKSSMGFKHYDLLADKREWRQENTVRSIIESPTGTIWIAVPEHGLFSVDPITDSVSNHVEALFNGLGYVFDLNLYDLFFIGDEELWICTYGEGVISYNVKTREVWHFRQDNTKLNSDLTYSLYKAGSDIWIGTEYGLNQSDLETGFLKSHKEKNDGLSDNRIRELFVDREGVIWAGNESGVDKIITQNNFKLYRNTDQTENSMPKGIVRSIFEDDQKNLWIGLLDNGLVRYDPSENEYTHFKHEPDNPSSIQGNDVNAIFQDSEGTLWLGDWKVGLIQYDIQKNRFKNDLSYEPDGYGLLSTNIQVIRESEPGILWIGTENGITRYEVKKGKITNYIHDEKDDNTLSGNSIQSEAMLFDKEGNLWAGTWTFGLNKIEFLDSAHQEYSVRHWQNNSNDPSSLNNDNVISLHEDKNGTLWIGTFGGGLSRFDPATNSFKAYTTKEGLPNNIIFGIIEDEFNRFWLSTDNGISLFDPERETFRNFTQDDGLQSNHFFWGAVHKGASGELFFGGIEGLNSFFPHEIHADTTRLKAILVSVRLFNRAIDIGKPTFKLTELKLKHDQNSLTFEFAALNFKNPRQILYQFYLEGFDKDWGEPGLKRIASYTNLPPGNYTLKLRLSNSQGIWSDEVYELLVIIKGPWWRTWWFYVLVVLGVSGLVYFIVILRFQILTRQKRFLEEEVIVRTREVVQKNFLLEDQAVEIKNQNEELQNQKSELAAKNDKLHQTLEKLKNTQRALLESEKMASLGVLTAGVAHEIKNPLNFIAVSIDNINVELNELDLSMLKADDAEAMSIIREMLGHAEIGTERILDITNRLKQYANHGSDSDELIHAADLVEDALKILHSKIPKHISIKKHFSEISPIVGHKYQISQVIINIIENAVHAISEKSENGKDEISITNAEEIIDDIHYGLIQISNTGPPIPGEALQKLFDPFFTTKAPNQGTGLGLYLSYNIIREHKGFITAQNRDKIVTFKIYLPI